MEAPERFCRIGHVQLLYPIASGGVSYISLLACQLTLASAVSIPLDQDWVTTNEHMASSNLGWLSGRQTWNGHDSNSQRS